MRKFKLFFACLLMSVLSIGQIWGAEQLAYTLTPTAGGDNGYATASDLEVDGITWNVTGNSTFVPRRIGGKNLNGVDRTVYSKDAMSAAITKVELTVGTASSVTVNSLKLIVASDEDFSDVIDEVTEDFTASSTITFEPTSPATKWATGAYYKFVFKVTIGGTNKYVQFTEAKFYAEESTGGDPVDPTITFNNGSVDAGYTLDLSTLFTSNSTGAVTYSITEGDSYASIDGSVLTGVAAGSVTVQASQVATASYNAAIASSTITVNAHTVTPGTYDIIFANAFWGTSGTGQNAGHTASGMQNDISVSINGNSGTQNYINNDQTRIYGSHTLTFSVPSGYVLKEITGLGTTSYSNISVASGSTGTITDRVWTGSANSVTFDLGSRTDFTTVSVTYAVYEAPTACATPTFSPAAGEYEEAQNVTISCETEGATIYYTTDGSEPKESGTKTQYTAAITVSTNQTIKAYAEKEGLLASEVAEAEYTFVAGPEVTLDFTSNDDWTFPTSKTVDANDYTKGSYTVTVAGSSGEGYYFDETNGNLLVGKSGAYLTLPTFDFPVSKVVCTAVIGGSGSVKFNLFDGVDAVSTEVSGCTTEQTFNIDAEDQESNKTYTIKVTSSANVRFAKIKVYRGVEPAVKKPVISGDENFVTSTEVTITCETAGATIYYTTNGDDPKVSGSTTPNPFSLTAGATVKAAAKLGSDWSAVAEKTFTKVDALSTMEAIQAAMPDEGTENINIIIEDWIVTAKTTTNVWFATADNTQGIMLYQSDHGFTAGNQLNGVVLNAGITKYNNAPELTSFTANDVTVTTASDVTPNEITIDAINTAIQGTVITLKDLTYSSASSNFSDGTNTIVMDTRLCTPTLLNEATYDLTGVVVYSKVSSVVTIKIMPRSLDDVVKTSADPLPEVDGLAELKAAELGSYEVTLTDAIVTLVDGNNAFIEEANAGALIYKSDHGFNAGDKLNGKYEVTTATYQGKFEITAITAQAGAETTPGATIPVTTLTIAQLNANFAAYESRRIKIVGVTVTDAVESGDATARTGEISDGTNTIALYAGKSGVIAAENANIDVIGYPTFHNTDQQLSVWAQADITVNQKEDAELAWSRTSDVIVAGASWTTPTLTNPHTVTIASYESDNEDVATVTDGGVIALAGGLGIANITAHFAGDQTYEAADVVYTITVNEYIPENTDIITAAKIGVEGTNAYDDWSGKNTFGTISVYAGNSANAASTNTGAIQLRSKNNSGIVLTSSNGLYLKNLSVTVKSGSNTLNIYAKNSAYESAADLYSNDEATRGTLIGTVSATGDMTLEEGISYNDNYQYIGLRSANNALYLDDITITWGDAYVAPTPDYTRTVEVNRYGTICLPNGGTIEGAKLYDIDYYDGTSTLYLLEVNGNAMVAGRPYIFLPSATSLKVFYTDDADEDAGTYRGLVGSYLEKTITANAGNYILYENAYYLVNSAARVGENRAYIHMESVPTTPYQQQGAPRRRVAMNVYNEQTTTDIDALNASETPVKMIIDGQLFIIRGEKMYNVNGQVVK